MHVELCLTLYRIGTKCLLNDNMLSFNRPRPRGRTRTRKKKDKKIEDEEEDENDSDRKAIFFKGSLENKIVS